ncbi:TnsA endonuclease N-terminal domain-containing protein [Lyngbya aestuarii]|uniref:TnsA endonuclease N-terminal domain-containing protein n=1 Tax=Lyngbya aestuarii TaxID=118322 RepID=UPI00403E2710
MSKGKPRRYTPDFVVTRPQKTQVVEVKPSNRADTEKNLNLFRKIAPICTANNQEFVVVTEPMIRAQPRLNNIKLLYKYARAPIAVQLSRLPAIFSLHRTDSSTRCRARLERERN